MTFKNIICARGGDGRGKEEERKGGLCRDSPLAPSGSWREGFGGRAALGTVLLTANPCLERPGGGRKDRREKNGNL